MNDLIWIAMNLHKITYHTDVGEKDKSLRVWLYPQKSISSGSGQNRFWQSINHAFGYKNKYPNPWRTIKLKKYGTNNDNPA